MELAVDEARRRFVLARVARLATCGADGQPHVVPVTFAVDDQLIVIAVDHKPKSTTQLKRLRNIQDNPNISLIVDLYDDDWERLWWVRADGLATVVHGGPEWSTPLDLLAIKYPQYRDHRPVGPVVRVDVTRWLGWAYGAASAT